MLEGFLKHLKFPGCLLLFKSEVCQLVGYILQSSGDKWAFHTQLVIFRRQKMQCKGHRGGIETGVNELVC